MEKTLSIVKPDAVSKNVIGKILDRFESAGLKIVAVKMIHLNDEKAKGFYAVHGSDSPESAAREIAYFFDDSEIVG